MKPLSLGLCLLSASTCAVAQPQTPDPFAALVGAPVASQNQTVSLAQLAKRGQPALILLKTPLNGATQVMVVAWGKDGVLLLIDNAYLFKPMAEVAALYDGNALVPDAPGSALQITDAVQVVPITELGDDAQVTAHYTLTNRGKTPLEVSVASTSCGCTAAKLDKSRIEPEQSAQLTAAMHASDERLVRVTLQTSDPAMPNRIVAVQSKRSFAPFQGPSPVALYGEKGPELSAPQPTLSCPSAGKSRASSPHPRGCKPNWSRKPPTRTPKTARCRVTSWRLPRPPRRPKARCKARSNWN